MCPHSLSVKSLVTGLKRYWEMVEPLGNEVIEVCPKGGCWKLLHFLRLSLLAGCMTWVASPVTDSHQKGLECQRLKEIGKSHCETLSQSRLLLLFNLLCHTFFFHRDWKLTQYPDRKKILSYIPSGRRVCARISWTIEYVCNDCSRY